MNLIYNVINNGREKMKVEVNITQKVVENMETDKINVIIESAKDNPYSDEVKRYIEKFNKENHEKLMVFDDNVVKTINYKDIILFYSEKKNNYCRTKDKVYKVRKTLQDLETIHDNFIRISKKCIVNLDHIKEFKFNTKGKVVILLDDGTEETVSRRKVKSIMNFIDRRSI